MAKQDELEEILKTLENFVDKRKEKIIKKKNRADWKPKTLKPWLPWVEKDSRAEKAPQ